MRTKTKKKRRQHCVYCNVSDPERRLPNGFRVCKGCFAARNDVTASANALWALQKGMGRGQTVPGIPKKYKVVPPHVYLARKIAQEAT